MEMEELVKIIFFVALLIVLIFLIASIWKGNLNVFDKFKELVSFR